MNGRERLTDLGKHFLEQTSISRIHIFTRERNIGSKILETTLIRRLWIQDSRTSEDTKKYSREAFVDKQEKWKIDAITLMSLERRFEIQETRQ